MIKLIGFLRESIATVTSKDWLKQHLRVSLYRNAYYLIGMTAVNAGLGLVFWIVGTNFYSTDSVGVYSAAINIAAFLAMLSTLGLDYGLIRFLSGSGERQNAMIDCSLTIGGAVSTVIALIFLAGVEIWSPALVSLRQDPLLFCAFVAFTIACTFEFMVRRAFVAARRSGFTVVQSLIGNLLKLGLVGLFAVFLTTTGIFISWVVALIVSLGIAMFLLLPRVYAGYRPRFAAKLLVKGSHEREMVKRTLHFSFANYAAVLLQSAPALILPALVANRLEVEDNAYFYIAWGMAGLLFAIPTGVSFSLFAEGSYDEKQLGRDTGRSLKIVFSLLVPAILVISLIADKLLLLFGEDYSDEGTWLLRILALSALPLAFNYVYFGAKRVEMKMKGVIGLNALSALATLGLSYVLLPSMGILGAGVAWLASQTAASLFTLKSFRDYLKRGENGSHEEDRRARSSES